MGKAVPIKRIEDIDRLKQYYIDRGELRNYALVTLALNLPIHLDQLLVLRWGDLFEDISGAVIRETVSVPTRNDVLRLSPNKETRKALIVYLESLIAKNSIPDSSDYIFKSRIGDKPIQRSAAYRVIARGAKDIGIDGLVGFESMRKTYGYHAWQAGVSRTSIMALYNHANLKVTKEFLTIEDEKEDVLQPMINL